MHILTKVNLAVLLGIVGSIVNNNKSYIKDILNSIITYSYIYKVGGG